MRRSPNGIVAHPMLENSRIMPIWAIYDTVNALCDFREEITGWKKKYSFISLFNHIVGFRKYNPLRLISYINLWWWNTFIVFLLVLFTIRFWPEISSWSVIENEWTKAILASIAASILYNLPAKIWQIGCKIIKS